VRHRAARPPLARGRRVAARGDRARRRGRRRAGAAAHGGRAPRARRALGELAWLQRRAELTAPSTERALRELLALQSSDWAFLIDAGTAGDYPRERFDGHLRAFEQETAPELR